MFLTPIFQINYIGTQFYYSHMQIVYRFSLNRIFAATPLMFFILCVFVINNLCIFLKFLPDKEKE